MRNPVICETSPCFSLSLVRDSFRGTFAKWPDACLEYIFVFAKTKWELSKTFLTVAVATLVGVGVGVGMGVGVALQAQLLRLHISWPHVPSAAFVCETVCQPATSSQHEKGILCFAKFNAALAL